MNMLNNKGKHGIAFLVVLALVLQIVGPMVSDFAYAMEEQTEVPVEEIEPKNLELDNSGEDEVDPEGSNLEDGSKDGGNENKEAEKSEEAEGNSSENEKDSDKEITADKEDEKEFSLNNIQPVNEIQENWVTGFDLTIIDNDNNQTKIEDESELEVDIDQMNSVMLAYTLEWQPFFRQKST